MTYGRALVVEGPGRMSIVDADTGEPGHGEALVAVSYTGICGSDRELVAGRRDPALVRYPVVPGHEWSGTVLALGEGADPGLAGRRVVGENFRNCTTCTPCRRGDTNLCAAGYDETGFTRPGACAHTLLVPARLLHVLPDDADLRAAALLEPAACMAAATMAAQVFPGYRVAVVGGGTLGLLAAQLLTVSGPCELVVIDPRPRPAAWSSGATDLRTPGQSDALHGRFDVVVETAGAPGSARLALRLARRGGRLVLTGLCGGSDELLVPAELVTSAVSVHTVFGAPSRAWSHAVDAFSAGLLSPLDLISDELPLADAARPLAPDAPGPTGKVLLRP